MFTEFSSEPEYKHLSKEVEKQGEQLQFDEMMVIHVQDAENLMIVDVPIINTAADEAHLCICRDVDSGEIIDATLEYDKKNDDEEAVVKTTRTLVGDSQFKETTQQITPDTFRDSMW